MEIYHIYLTMDFQSYAICSWHPISHFELIALITTLVSEYLFVIARENVYERLSPVGVTMHLEDFNLISFQTGPI